MLRLLDRLEEVLIATLIAVATVLVFITVTHRFAIGLAADLVGSSRLVEMPALADLARSMFKIFNALKMTWAQEACIYLFVWRARFGAACGVRTGVHVRADILAERLIQAQAEAIAKSAPADLTGYTRVKQELVAPPFAPVHDQVATGGPKIVEVHLETQQRLMTVDGDTGAEIWALSYNGSVRGPQTNAHEGDHVEVTLRNPTDGVFEPDIDFHASSGALGGGGLTHVFPGKEAVPLRKATKPGVLTCHCVPGGEMIPCHICHGMNGTMKLQPGDGLKHGQGNPLRHGEIAHIGRQDYSMPMNEEGSHKT